jgi:hypothetical protein
MIPMWIFGVGIAVILLGSAWVVRNNVNGLLGFGGAAASGARSGKPTIWWIVDDSQVNSRQWLDWGNRSTREPNEPYLKICLARANAQWGDSFVIEPVIGRLAALQRLESAGVTVPAGADRSPPALWMPWCRAAFLSRFGGLWLDGSVLPVTDVTGSVLRGRLTGADALTFGSDPDEGLSAAEQTEPAAGRSAGWAAVPGHPMWSGLERDIGALIGEGDQSWGAPEARRALRTLWDNHCSGVTRVDRRAEVSRDQYGRRLELDTLLGQTDWPEGSTEGGLWVPLPDGRDGLERASPWLWFTRMSEEQIRESEFVWARWATRA